MTDSRGRHSKGKFSGNTYAMNGPRVLAPERKELLKKWQRMTNAEREGYSYSFEQYGKENGR